MIILNDNEMSISPNVGAIAGYLNRIVTGQVYNRFKKEVEVMLLSTRSLIYRISSTTPLRNRPTPSASTSMTSPGLR